MRLIHELLTSYGADAEITALPHDDLRLSYTIVYDDPLIGTQHGSVTLTISITLRVSPGRGCISGGRSTHTATSSSASASIC